MSAENDWYLYRGQQRWGPYSWQQMIEMAQSGNIQSSDQLWHSDYPDFVNANQVRGLFDVKMPIKPITKELAIRDILLSIVQFFR